MHAGSGNLIDQCYARVGSLSVSVSFQLFENNVLDSFPPTYGYGYLRLNTTYCGCLLLGLEVVGCLYVPNIYSAQCGSGGAENASMGENVGSICQTKS